MSITKKQESNHSELINNMINGYALHEIICNSQGEPIDFRFIEVNKAFTSITGLKAEDVLGHTILEVIPSIDKIWIEKYRKVALTRIPNTFEAFDAKLDKQFQVKAYLPKTKQLACFFLDITDKKIQEKELIKSEKGYKLLFEGSSDAIYIQDSDGIILKTNSRASKMLGYTNEDLIGMTVFQIDSIDERKYAKERIDKLMSKGHIKFESKHVTKSGKLIPVDVSAWLTKWNDQPAITSVCRDISIRKQAEVTLRESEKKYRSIFENAPDGIFVVDENGQYLSVNKACESITGYTQNELTSMSIPQIYPQYTTNQSMKHLTQAIKTGAASGEKEFIHKSGLKLWWSIDAIKLSETRVLGFAKEITNRKIAEAALEKRMLSLLQPLNENADIAFDELFDLTDIQRIQDEFSDATGVASIITTTDGKPITSPSNFRNICLEIRKTKLGQANCFSSDAAIGLSKKDGPTIQKCLSAGLWDAGASITIGGKHIANWLIGQVRDETITEEEVISYTRTIGVDDKIAIKSFHAVPIMSKLKFEKISRILFTLANQLSTFAYQNVQQARFITDLEKTKVSLRESEEHFQSLFQDAPLAYQSLNKDGLFIDVNNAWLSTLGYNRKEVIGKWFGDFLHPSLTEKFRKRFTCFQSQGKVHTEFIMIHKNGEHRHIEFDGRIKHNSDGTFCRTHCILNDITKRKLAEQALLNEREQLVVTLRSIGEGVITTDINGNIIMLNKVAEELTGWSANDAQGRSLHDVFNIVNKIKRNKCQNLVSKVLKNNEIVKMDNNVGLIAKDGREILIANTGAPIHNSDSKVVGVVVAFRDMTNKQELDNSMQRAQKLESIGMLAGGIAHDFNNILSGIFGFVEMALEETEETKVTHYLTESLGNIDRARALTKQLLTFAKGGAPVKKIENLFPFVQKTVEFALSGSPVLSQFHVQEALWPCEFDKNQIGQVIDNLTINAQQAMPNGGKIEVTAINTSLLEQEHISLEAGNYVKLSMKDQGIGIPKDYLAKIFDPYFTTKSKGHGLGLATCYSIINRHGGCIDIASEPGHGSTFHVYFPSSSATISDTITKTPVKHSGTGTFLIMDDEKSILKIMKIMLEAFGYSVVSTNNGQEAIDFFLEEFNANRKISGMIFDITIPGGIGGKEAIEEIRKTCSNTPAFVASGYSQDPIMANPEKFGFIASLNKPFRMAELSEMLEKHLVKH